MHTHLAGEAGHSFEVVGEHIGASRQNDVDCLGITLEIADQYLQDRIWAALFHGTDGGSPMSGPTIG